MNITLNSSEYLFNPSGQALPEITATIRDLGTGEALFFAFLVYLAAVIVHELSHWFVLLRHNPNARIFVQRKGIGLQLKTGTEADYMALENSEKNMLYFAGIAGGLVPILIAAAIHPLYALVLPGYLAGCIPDARMIWANMKKKETEA